MSSAEASWSTQQLTEFLATVSSFTNEDAAERGAIERVAEALEAEVAILVTDGSVVASVGFPEDSLPEEDILGVLRRRDKLVVPGTGPCPTVILSIEEDPPIQLIVARSGAGGFSHEEMDLLRGMGRVLSLTLALLRALAMSRLDAVAAERARADAVKGAILESALD
ncbi:MAG: hypothetical protein ACRDH9_12630, partial [Actinomycetota bacterium]